MQFISLAVLGKRIKAIRFMMKDKSVPKRKKALVVAGLIYLFLPLDLIPPIIPVFGFLDDLVLWLFILSYLKDELDKYWMGEDAPQKVREKKKKYRGKNIVDGVEYEVWDDEDGPKSANGKNDSEGFSEDSANRSADFADDDNRPHRSAYDEKKE